MTCEVKCIGCGYVFIVQMSDEQATEYAAGRRACICPQCESEDTEPVEDNEEK